MGLLAMMVASFAVAAPGAQADECRRACEMRVQCREMHAKWRRDVRRYGIARLDARMRCESGSHGGYELTTTGNSYWFSMQWNAAAWVGSGGRMRHGRPVGVWTTQPSRLEQQVRAVYWDRVHGGDPWPSCP